MEQPPERGPLIWKGRDWTGLYNLGVGLACFLIVLAIVGGVIFLLAVATLRIGAWAADNPDAALWVTAGIMFGPALFFLAIYGVCYVWPRRVK